MMPSFHLHKFLPDLSSEKILKLEQLVCLFLEWNKKLNLSSIRDPEGVSVKHVLDSLLIRPYGWIHDTQKVLDLGTGGGFPGLALAIIYPKTLFTLVDTREKKIKAVESIAKTLGLKNVLTFFGRAEELGRKRDFREQFDVVIARALASFSTLLEYCLPFVRVGGKFVAYQGPDILKNWKQYSPIAETLSSDFVDIKETFLPIEDAKRCFVVLKKTKPLSQKYPRKIGVPKKNPLITDR